MKSLFKKLFSKDKVEISDFVDNEEESEYRKMLRKLSIEAIEQNESFYGNLKFSENSVYAEFKKLSPAEKTKFYFTLIAVVSSLRKKGVKYNSAHYKELAVYESLMALVIRNKMEFTDNELLSLMDIYKTNCYSYKNFSSWPIGHTVIQFEKQVKAKGLSEELKSGIQEVLKWKEFSSGSGYWGSDLEKASLKLRNLVVDKDDPSQSAPAYELNTKDPFGVYANKYLKELDEKTRDGMYQILPLAAACSGSKPTKKFQTTSKEIVEKINPQKYKEIAQNWMEFVVNLKTEETQSTHNYSGHEYTYSHYMFLYEKNSTLLKGIVWSLLQFHDTKTLQLLARLAERSFQKIPGVGPSAAGLGNACIYCLAFTKGLEGVSHLSRLKLKIAQNNTRKLIQKYIDEISDKRGISSAEIEEMAVPDFGLTDGKLETAFNDYKLILSIDKVGKTILQWYKPDGAAQKSVPAFVKNSTKLNDRLKKIRALNKQVLKYSTAQRDRIDRSYIQKRKWTYENYIKYYHNHGLVSSISKKLIWVFEDADKKTSAIWNEDQWQEVNGAAVDWISEETKVTLWHPLDVEAGEVIAWRVRLEQLEVQQPMKQAYREVYILTEAEINTKTYSNRMAAHILKQHQLNALTSIRGWKYSLLGCYDDGRDSEYASLPVKEWGITAQFWINEVYADDAFNDTGIWLYVSTDQIRFNNQEGNPIDLIDVPKIVFSEIMRDVDLFVGVCSVGNDPNWSDNGGLPQYNDYWHSYSFGDLTEVAKTRKTVLERLVPRLKIKNVAEIKGKFLIVKGKIRTYKIHIGSSNILMEPNDQYLCIVPSRKADTKTDKVFLPFEGDRGLSVVLSKAFLLADDDKIKDSTITSQINRK